ncbi:MAG: hypothetical protein BMS9Abin29_1041 [Gemmatimonadota bacterium]|nr:MAG: hypothetical protein BMS9Abin29_1041 [Gemmatimonadota bacterium]
MSNLLYRIRGLAGVGITWGALWGVIGAGIGLVIGLVSPGAWDWTNPILDWAFGMGLYGAVSGVGFATLLSLGEGRKTILDLSLRRVALWGVLGSAAVPLLFNAMGSFASGTTATEILGAIAVTGFLGGTFAPASVAIARRAALSAGEENPLLESET